MSTLEVWWRRWSTSARAGCWVIVMLQAARVAAFEGQLVWPDGQPLAGARVAVLGRAGSAVSNAEGRFAIAPDPAPPFRLIVSLPDGVALAPIEVAELPPGRPLLVEVLPAVAEAVTVISGAVPDLEVPPAAALTVVGRNDIEQRLPSRLTDILENVPGTGRLEEGHSAVPSVRGLARGRTLILLDEGRVTAERRAGPSASYLDPETVEEVEIVRGPGAVAYGSDALGGVIRARSRYARPADSPRGRLTLSGGLGIDGGGAAGEASFGLLDGGLLFGFHARKFGEYDSPAGEVFNSAAEDRGLRAGYQRPAFGGTLQLAWRSDFGRDIGKPDTTSRVVRAYYPVEDSHRVQARFERAGPGGWSQLSFSGFFDGYRLITNRDRAATATAAGQIAQADVDARDYGLRASAERRFGEARLFFGADLNGRFGLAAVNRTLVYGSGGPPVETQTEIAIESARRDDLGLFVGGDRRWQRFGLVGGARFDWVRASNQGGYFGDHRVTDRAPSGFAAVSIGLRRDTEFTAQVARGFRVPLLSDRYFRGVSGRGFVTGNPDLEPESSVQTDLAVRHTRGDWSIAVFAYFYRIRDLIERYREGDDFFFRNRGQADLRGLELELAAPLPGGLRLELSAQAQRGEVVDDDQALDDVPPRALLATVRGFPAGPWNWFVRGAVYAGDDRPGPTEIETPAYGLVDAGVGIRFGEDAELQLLGRNLFDHAYPWTPDPGAVLAPGRSLQANLRLSFGG